MQTFLWHPKQVQKKLSENTGKTFFHNYAFFYMQGVGIFTEMTVPDLQESQKC